MNSTDPERVDAGARPRDVAVNLNWSARVRLTGDGERVWREFWAPYGGDGGRLKQDGEGRVRLQLHEIMLVFGPHLMPGFGGQPLETEIMIEVQS